MALTYIPRQRSPWETMLPGFLSQFVFQGLAEKRAQKRFAAQQAQKEKEELRRYKAAGWRQSGTQKPVIEVGGEGLLPPKRGFETREVQIGEETGIVPVETMTPYGESPQITRTGAIKTKSAAKQYKPGTIELYDSKSRKTMIYPTKIVGGKLVVDKSAPLGEKKPTGVRLTQTPEGGFTFAMGGGLEQGPGKLTPTVKSGVQKSVISLQNRKARLESIMGKWKPEYNTWATRGSMWVRELQDKAQGLPGVKTLNPKQKQELSEFTTFRTSSLQDFSQLINDLAGSTLTPLEAKIHRAWIQDAKKDSPVQYASKLKENYTMVEKQLARENYYLNMQGMSPQQFDKLRRQSKISMAEFDTAVDTAYAKYVARIRAQNPQKPWQEIKEEALNMIEANFFGF